MGMVLERTCLCAGWECGLREMVLCTIRNVAEEPIEGVLYKITCIVRLVPRCCVMFYL